MNYVRLARRSMTEAAWSVTNMIKKLIVAAAATAVAISFAPTASFAKRMHKQRSEVQHG